MKAESIVKLSLVALLVGCLLSMQYRYYQFVRIGATLGFFYLLSTKEHFASKVIWVGCVILFNPIIKMFLSKENWHIIDVIVASLLLLSFIPFTMETNKNQ